METTTQKPTDQRLAQPVVVSSDWFGWLFPKKPKPAYKDEPCFVVRHDGEVEQTKLRTFSGGQMAVWCVIAWREAYPDGRITEQYPLAKKWFRP